MGFKRVVFGRQTGLRRGKLTCLKWDDVYFERETVAVRSKPDINWRIKNNEERVVPLGKDALKILRELYRKKKPMGIFGIR
jgi:integrase